MKLLIVILIILQSPRSFGDGCKLDLSKLKSQNFDDIRNYAEDIDKQRCNYQILSELKEESQLSAGALQLKGILQVFECDEACPSELYNVELVRIAKAACDKGMPDACFTFEGANLNLKKIVPKLDFYIKHCEKGSLLACQLSAYDLFSKKDRRWAKYMKKACSLNSKDSCSKLAPGSDFWLADKEFKK